MVNSRNPEQTKARILAAATKEFVSKGLAGARVDEIAALSGVNKRMIYHYFGDKEGLYRAVVEANFAAFLHDITDQSPFDVAIPERLARLMAWEGLAPATQNVAASGPWSPWVAQIRRLQDETEMGTAHDAGHLALVLLAVAAFPHICPGIAHALTGITPNSAAFSEVQQGLLHSLERVLKSASSDGKKPRVKLKPTITPAS